MNNRLVFNASFEKTLSAQLLNLLKSVSWLNHSAVIRSASMNVNGFNFSLDLHMRGQGKNQLRILCKADPRPSQLPSIFSVREASQPYVFVLGAPFVSQRVAEVCEEAGWGWFDLAGNCHLDIPGILHIQRSGNAPVNKRPRPVANLGTPEAGRIIRALLHSENAGIRWTQRYMAEHFGKLKNPIPEPSIGLVNKVVRYLRDEAFIENGAKGGFLLRDPMKLLFAWRDAYRFDRHERRGYFTLLRGKKLDEALAGLDASAHGFAAYAAFSAAEKQAPHVRQPKTWLYLLGKEITRFEEMAEAKQVESGENLVVLIPDDEGVFYPGDTGRSSYDRMACTSEVQTYVDVWHCGGRGREAADALLDQRLKPAWRKGGLKI